MESKIRICVEKIRNSAHLICFSGAGISAESGVPTFRDEDGIWKKYSPEIFDINYFNKNSKECWQAIYDLFILETNNIIPNAAHNALYELEKKGYLKAIITQNIDNLHQKAGNKNVIEFHGNTRELICPKCHKLEEISYIDKNNLPPLCSNCNSVLKPNFVFFGEQIPEQAYNKSYELVQKSDVIIVIGTSGAVYPAAIIPEIVKNNGGCIIEINPNNNVFALEKDDVYIQLSAVEAMTKIVNLINQN